MEKSIKFSEHVLRKNIFIEDNDPSTTKTKSLNPKTIRITVTDPYAIDSSEDENKSVVVKRVKKHVPEIKIKRKRKKKSTKYRGLYQSPSGKWVAQIRDTSQKKTIWLGTYNTAIEAALAYDEAAVKLKEAHHAVTTLKKSTRLEIKYRGVTMRPSRKWGAYIQDQGKYFWLGTFDTAEEAAMVHDKAALRLKRSLAVINFPSVVVLPVSVVASNEDAFGNGFGDMHEPKFGDGFDLPEFGRYRVDEFGQFHIG